MSRVRPIRHAVVPTRRVTRIIALSLTGVLAFGVTAGALIYDRILGNLDGRKIDHLITAPRPTSEGNPDDNFGGSPLNILIMGSDSRSDENSELVGDGIEGMRSDTQMIMHISQDRSRVEVVSLPRDSWVEIPSCRLPDGSDSAPREGKLNGAFALGGRTGDVDYAAACAIATIEQTTQVRMDGFVVMDFTGFEKMIDTLGGVDMCVPQDINAPKANLNISAGSHRLDGKTALAFARARIGSGLGDQSDIGRISRQQELFANVADQALSQSLLTNTPVLLNFLEAFTDSLTMSSNLSSVPNLTGLAWSIRNIRPADIRFYTTPHAARPNDPANVIWTEDAALVWDALRHDTPITEPTEAPADEEADDDAQSGTGTTPADDSTSTTEPTPEIEPTTEAPEPTQRPQSNLDIDSVSADDVDGVCG